MIYDQGKQIDTIEANVEKVYTDVEQGRDQLSKASTYQVLFTTQPRLLMTLGKNPFENIVRKGENVGNEQFLLFPPCFQLNQITVSPFVHIFYITSLFAIGLEEPRISI